MGAVDRNSTGKRRICQAFRELIDSCSASTFMVRAPSFDESDLDALEKAERAQVGDVSVFLLVVCITTQQEVF